MSLTLTDITLTYPDGASRVTALDHVSLHVPDGTMTAVIGPSGSGKSSLLAVAATLITPDAGTISIDGTAATQLTARERTRLRANTIGIVFQNPNLLPALTSRDQLEAMAHISGRRTRDARDRALHLLDAVGMLDCADRRPHQLSGGERQRVNIARALMNDPSVLLVDEPTSALDHTRGAAIIDLIATLTREQDTSTLLVTHDPTHLASADTVVEMRDSRLHPSAVAPV